MDALRHDLRFAIRSFLRSPGFSAVTVLTLALGIEATTAIFSVVYGVLLRPLPYPDSDRIVRVWQLDKDGNRDGRVGSEFRRLVALVASYVPARRALRVDPMNVLRNG